ncbi:MAG: cation transporter [Clostridia bacterium]|nr:cation transporter [Clostridia bacterium]
MVSLLSKIFIKKPESLTAEAKREKYGVLCGTLGIALNLFLFAVKIFAGLLSGAISIVADALNNLSDAGSSLVTMLGFKLAAKKPDVHHPFGHGRFEYVSGLFVSMLILLVGFELGKTSIEKIFSPEEIVFSWLSIAILAISIAVKLYMAYYNRIFGKKLASTAMEATAVDALSDSVATSVVLICMLISRFTDANLDAWCGLAVSAFILYSGIRSVKETMDPLLGEPPTEEFVKQIENIVKECPHVCGIHDLMVHDYGPGRRVISLHAEVPANSDLLEIHDAIDNTEKRLHESLHCDAVIHMDPIQTDNALVAETRAKVETLLKILDERISIHDFRMVTGNTHTNVIFDAVLPYDLPYSDKEAHRKITELVRTLDGNYFAVVEIDKGYI